VSVAPFKHLGYLNPDLEKSRFNALSLTIEKELFRLLLNFAQNATAEGRYNFPFSIENVADRLGKKFQYISKLRQRFTTLGLISQTAPHVPNVSAARYRWLEPTKSEIAAA
jgi:hypothetical protein